MTESERVFPNWNELYKQPVESMPWFNKDLDADLENALDTAKITKGRFLDLGTGPGTQAIHLAKRGFKVTGADLSENAINKARKLSNKVNFITDDILDSKLGSMVMAHLIGDVVISFVIGLIGGYLFFFALPPSKIKVRYTEREVATD